MVSKYIFKDSKNQIMNKLKGWACLVTHPVYCGSITILNLSYYFIIISYPVEEN